MCWRLQQFNRLIVSWSCARRVTIETAGHCDVITGAFQCQPIVALLPFGHGSNLWDAHCCAFDSLCTSTPHKRHAEAPGSGVKCGTEPVRIYYWMMWKLSTVYSTTFAWLECDKASIYSSNRHATAEYKCTQTIRVPPLVTAQVARLLQSRGVAEK